MDYLESLTVAEREAFDQATRNLSEMVERNGLSEVISASELNLNLRQMAQLERSGLTSDGRLKYFYSEKDNIGLVVMPKETGRYNFELFYKDGYLAHNDRSGWIVEDLEDQIKNEVKT